MMHQYAPYRFYGLEEFLILNIIGKSMSEREDAVSL
jgi:hypothetical protein